jgi:hypothetical protein
MLGVLSFFCDFRNKGLSVASVKWQFYDRLIFASLAIVLRPDWRKVKLEEKQGNADSP